ncbi:hypothetical protein KM043_005223 [Ampulex compressa]|nr:hypothetical protein KM043_005223 [Ampulex compressa]
MSSVSVDGVSVKTDMGASGAISRLYIANANKKDSGNYSCALADVAAVTMVSVHVLNVMSRIGHPTRLELRSIPDSSIKPVKHTRKAASMEFPVGGTSRTPAIFLLEWYRDQNSELISGLGYTTSPRFKRGISPRVSKSRRLETSWPQPPRGQGQSVREAIRMESSWLETGAKVQQSRRTARSFATKGGKMEEEEGKDGRGGRRRKSRLLVLENEQFLARLTPTRRRAGRAMEREVGRSWLGSEKESPGGAWQLILHTPFFPHPPRALLRRRTTGGTLTDESQVPRQIVLAARRSTSLGDYFHRPAELGPKSETHVASSPVLPSTPPRPPNAAVSAWEKTWESALAQLRSLLLG